MARLVLPSSLVVVIAAAVMAAVLGARLPPNSVNANALQGRQGVQAGYMVAAFLTLMLIGLGDAVPPRAREMVGHASTGIFALSAGLTTMALTNSRKTDSYDPALLGVA